MSGGCSFDEVAVSRGADVGCRGPARSTKLMEKEGSNSDRSRTISNETPGEQNGEVPASSDVSDLSGDLNEHGGRDTDADGRRGCPSASIDPNDSDSTTTVAMASTNSLASPDSDSESACLGPTPTVQDIDDVDSSNSYAVSSSMSVDMSPRGQPGTLYENLLQQHCNTLYAKAKADMAAERWQDAIIKVTRAIGSHNKNPLYYELRGQAYLEMGDFKSAAVNYRTAAQQYGDLNPLREYMVTIWYMYGRCLYEMSLYEEALTVFNAVVSNVDVVCPVEYHCSRISCLAKLKRHSECADVAAGLVQAYGDNADIYVLMARLQSHIGMDSECYYSLQTALDVDPLHPLANSLLQEQQKRALDCHSLAVSLCLQNNYRDAIDAISRAIACDPCNGDYSVFRGMLHRRARNFPSAVDDFTMAVAKVGLEERSETMRQAFHHLSLTYNELAVECFRKRFYNEAIVLLNRAIRHVKTDPGFYINRGDCHYCVGELHFALADYEQALLLDAQDWAVRGRLSMLHCVFGGREHSERQYERSLVHYTNALHIHPGLTQAYAQRARVHFMMQNLSHCQGDILSALQLDAKDEMALAMFARVFTDTTLWDVQQTPAWQAAGRHVKTAVEQCKADAMLKKRNHDKHWGPGKDQVEQIEDITEMLATLLVERSGRKKTGIQDEERPTCSTTADNTLDLSVLATVAGGSPEMPPKRSKPKAATQRADTPSSTVSLSRESFQLAMERRRPPPGAPQSRLPDIPEPAMPPLEACIADQQFFKSMVQLKKEANTKFSKLLHRRTSLEKT